MRYRNSQRFSRSSSNLCPLAPHLPEVSRFINQVRSNFGNHSSLSTTVIPAKNEQHVSAMKTTSPRFRSIQGNVGRLSLSGPYQNKSLVSLAICSLTPAHPRAHPPARWPLRPSGRPLARPPAHRSARAPVRPLTRPPVLPTVKSKRTSIFENASRSRVV